MLEVQVNGEYAEAHEETPLTVRIIGDEEGAQDTHRCTGCGETASDPDEGGQCHGGSGSFGQCPECSGQGGCNECGGSEEPTPDCGLCHGTGECPGDCDEGEIEIHQWESIGLTWLNSAAIHVDEGMDEVAVTISVGDPRGAFAFTIRRMDDGRLIMHTPYPGEPSPHMTLTELHTGTYVIGD